MEYSFKEYIQLLKVLRKHQSLAMKRHPALEQNKIGKFFSYFSLVFIVLYLMFFAVMFAVIANSSTSITAVGLLYGIMPFILIIDFLFRFTIQQTPSQQIKPYVLLNIPKKACIDSFLTSSVINSGNLIWMALFLPYSIMSVLFGEGFLSTLLFLISLHILILINSQWFSAVRTLINRNVLWWGLPIVVYALCLSPWYIGKNTGIDTLCDFYAWAGEYLPEPHIVAWIVLLSLFIGMIAINRWLQNISVWEELSQVEVTKLKRVSRFSFLEKYGLVGEYLKLELKSVMRNKNMRKQFIFANTFVLIISLLVAFTDIYDSQFMNYFWTVYCFAVYGAFILSRSMCAEGNYIDGLMVHMESLLALITAKYYFATTLLLVPFILLLPTVIMGKYTLLMLFSMLMFTAGFQHCMFLQLSVYNKQTVPLNTKFIGKGAMETNYMQVVFNMAAFFLPIVMLYVFYFVFNDLVSYILFSLIGVVLVLSHRLWLKNIYCRMMHRKYGNLEGFRASRE